MISLQYSVLSIGPDYRQSLKYITLHTAHNLNNYMKALKNKYMAGSYLIHNLARHGYFSKLLRAKRSELARELYLM